MSDQIKQLVADAAEQVRQGHFEAGLEAARRALEVDSRSSDAYGVLGVSLARLGRYDEATDAFQRAIQTNSYSARNYYNLAMHYYGLGNKSDAISMCQEAIRCDGKHRNAHDLLKKLEGETKIEIAPYQTSLGDQRGTAYTYKKDETVEEPPF
jgi:Flp pilus assembly protein TadD